MEDIGTYRKMFVGAAKERVEQLQQQLLGVRNNLADQGVLKEMHITAHSLKGEAYAVGYKHIGDLATVVEKYIKSLLTEEKSFPIEKFPAFAYAIAMVVSAVTKVEEHQLEPDLTDVIKTSREQLGISL